ncbi:hypothetical protein CesoFtcFv8_022956 [Champsocephalus esox]|uniref:Uncharacterized protein n=1 Tax=Champsocephalus esox TaxID=159716 RepID=A0AAN8GJA5_9TELE|nr:hypothetical protein CesoFtcFv8_022956 [Champsocephalus esox]
MPFTLLPRQQRGLLRVKAGVVHVAQRRGGLPPCHHSALCCSTMQEPEGSAEMTCFQSCWLIFNGTQAAAEVIHQGSALSGAMSTGMRSTVE